MATNFCHTQLVSLLGKQRNQLDRLYAEKARQIGAVLRRYNLKDERNVWRGNAAVEKEIDKILMGLDDSVKEYIKYNVGTAAKLSHVCNDAMTDHYTKGMELPPDLKAAYAFRNVEATIAFNKLRKEGLELSSRVWNLAGNTKDQLEYFLREGLGDGTSAAELARDVQKYLKEPNRRFRRVRNEEGKLVLSDPAKLYKPGRGVYRSSYKNALRMTKEEINLSYRYADYERRKQLDFVLGTRVNLSAQHVVYDICDELAGAYPKNFVFPGWHIGCLCFTTSVSMKQSEFVKSVKSGIFDKSKQIDRIPKRAEKYLNDNAATIKGWKKKPYFIKENFKNTKEGFALKNNAKP